MPSISAIIKIMILSFIVFMILSIIGFTVYGFVKHEGLAYGIEWLNTDFEEDPDYIDKFDPDEDETNVVLFDCEI